MRRPDIKAIKEKLAETEWTYEEAYYALFKDQDCFALTISDLIAYID